VYERPVAHVKHLGGFGQGYFKRRAELAGFDEALLVDRDGVVSEGAITNLGCHDGSSIVWPDAPALHGITMWLLEQALPSRRAPVRVADLTSYATVLITNSHGIAAVERVDDMRLPVDESIVAKVREAYHAVPWDRI
jgi:branched-subunit amino acid aminotransferase/4-amino-4-deoxychorismate lyase